MSLVLDTSYRVTECAGLSLERHDIEFYCPRPDQVAIGIKLTNEGESATGPTLIRIDAAPLGAFVPWRPLAEVLVPTIGPRGSHRVQFAVERPHTRPIGRHPGDIPPARLLTALGMGEPPRQPRQIVNRQAGAGTIAFQTRPLPPDVFELLGSRNPHWAGNLNIFVGGRAVERHLARALRIYPGRVNLAFFMVGSGRDAYSFEFGGEGANWEAALYDPLSHRSPLTLLSDPDHFRSLGHGEWLEVERQAVLLLAIRPPQDCRSGNIDVHVTQRSTGNTAIVEFSLDRDAAGPGCFVVT